MTGNKIHPDFCEFCQIKIVIIPLFASRENSNKLLFLQLKPSSKLRSL